MADCAGVPGGVDPAGDIYNTYGVGCLEATVDILTGQIMLDRADIIYDLGRSVNPFVDIGQVEGAFVIGVGQLGADAPTCGVCCLELLSLCV
ncbi:Indole-3-acetaldehyde oxidase [Diplonema papillatum]|nr:Indole-3-acetaldehyde oxidase [Diplonema papillatum]